MRRKHRPTNISDRHVDRVIEAIAPRPVLGFRAIAHRAGKFRARRGLPYRAHPTGRERGRGRHVAIEHGGADQHVTVLLTTIFDALGAE
jgi:hypothetical protein